MSTTAGAELLHPVQRVLGHVVAELDALGEPGPDGVDGCGLWSLGDREVDALLTGLVRAGDRLRVRVLDLVGEAERRNRAAAAGATSHRAWLAQLLHVLPGEAGRMITAAAALTGAAADPVTSPLSGDARDGAAPVEQAVIAARGITALPEDLTDDQRAAAVVIVRTAARDLDPARLREVTDHLIATVDPDRGDALLEDQLRRAERRAHALRDLVIGRSVDGVVRGRFQLPAADAAVLRTALEALAKPRPATGPDGPVTGDTSADPVEAIVPPAGDRTTEIPTAAKDDRTHPQRMADALVELARRSLAGDDLPDTGGHRPQVVVTITLEHLQQAIGAAITTGGTTLSAATARRIACDAGILPVVLGSAGQPLDIGRDTRAVPTGIRRALVLRDRGCTFPGCDRPPSWCDAHHIRHWADGGETSLVNLVLLCGHHHRVTHHQDWKVRVERDGHPHWYSPGWPVPDPAGRADP